MMLCKSTAVAPFLRLLLHQKTSTLTNGQQHSPLLLRFAHTAAAVATISHTKLLVLGGGSGGCAAAAQLHRRLGGGGGGSAQSPAVTIVEPADTHYYQPMFTLIGGGINTLADAGRPMSTVLPAGVRWLRDSAVRIEPSANLVHTADGHQIKYDQLLIAVGLQLHYDRIPGLSAALARPDANVTSIYSPQHVEQHLPAMRRFRGGPVLFTFPLPPVKCPGAPQKIAYLTEHYLRRHGQRTGAQLTYVTALPVIFSVPYYAQALWPIARERGIEVMVQQHLVEVRGADNVAVFESVERPGERLELPYALLHVTPPMGVPPVLSASIGDGGEGLVNAAGFVDVDAQTLRHVRWPNVWALGDCAATVNPKTMAAAAAQSGVVVDNILAVLAGQPPTAAYDGYAACPLVTGYDRCVMAEFDYQLQPLETFPLRQNRELRSMFLLKKYAMPLIYWRAMVRGWWRGPAWVRRALSVFRLG